MSQYLEYDQKELYKNAKELITRFESSNTDPGEFIKINETPKDAKSIRLALYRMNLDPLDKAMEKGSKSVRKYFNDKNLRKRIGVLEK